MATYAAYRHIELDKVGYSKKRVRNPPSDIFNVLCTPSPNNNNNNNGSNGSLNGSLSPRRASSHDNSFNRLFGSPDSSTPRKLSLTKADVANRNPVTGNGVTSWDCKPEKRNSPKIHTERNPVTGEYYTIVSPATTPTKPVLNGVARMNGNSTPMLNGNQATNGQA